MIKPRLNFAQFAEVMGVHRSQVTRWVQLGLPLLPDGLVDPVAGARWVRGNVDSVQRRRRSLGAQQMVDAEQREEDEAIDQMLRLAIRVAVHAVPAIAQEAAKRAGLEAAQVAAVYAASMGAAPRLEAEVSQWLDLPDDGQSALIMVTRPMHIDWSKPLGSN